MPRPIFKQREKNNLNTNNILSTTMGNDSSKTQSAETKMKVDKLLRKRRSKEYVEFMEKLDAGGHCNNQHYIDEIMGMLHREFPDVIDIGGGLPIGFIAKCYLGDPYEVHTVDLTGRIIYHFMKGESMPNGMENARGIAARGGYAFVEVYSDCCRAIGFDGSVSVI